MLFGDKSPGPVTGEEGVDSDGAAEGSDRWWWCEPTVGGGRGGIGEGFRGGTECWKGGGE